jgi:hypothetical protein
MWRTAFGVILLVVSIAGISSCSTARKRGTADVRNLTGIFDSNEFGDAVKALNINGEGFIIKKANVILEGTEIEGNFGLYAKVNSKGDFFVSVRGPLGIEIARAISAGDSVFVINKINRVVLYGSRSSLLQRAGLPENLIEIITGDMPDTVSFSGAKTSQNGMIYLSYSDVKYRNDITVDRSTMKISEEIIRTSDDEVKYLLKFGKFIDSGKKRYASTVEVESMEKMFHVKINILELLLGFDEKIEIVLPAYRRESL